MLNNNRKTTVTLAEQVENFKKVPTTICLFANYGLAIAGASLCANIAMPAVALATSVSVMAANSYALIIKEQKSPKVALFLANCGLASKSVRDELRQEVANIKFEKSKTEHNKKLSF